MRSIFRVDERGQSKHLELVLKNALEGGYKEAHTLEEQVRYRSVMTTLCQSDSGGEALRREAMTLFTLDKHPDFVKLNELYQRVAAQPTSIPSLDAAPYLCSFFEALQAQLYADSFFKQQLSDVIQNRAALSMIEMQRSIPEVVATLHQINETLADHYTPDQFEKDVHDYTTYIVQDYHILQLVGYVPKGQGNENRHPELDSMFVPLRTKGKDRPVVANDSIVDVLENSPCVMLLGGPGSGKSTLTRYLAWSHAEANLSGSTDFTNIPLLSGKPLPLHIPLRRLNEARQKSDYSFLTYVCKVQLEQAGWNIRSEMFEILLERRTMLVLLDGLDEIALDDRRQLVEDINAFVQRYPGNRFLVTSRPVGYEFASLSAVHIILIIQTAQRLYEGSLNTARYFNIDLAEKEVQLAKRIVLGLIQRIDLSFEARFQVAQMLYGESTPWKALLSRSGRARLLLRLAERPMEAPLQIPQMLAETSAPWEAFLARSGREQLLLSLAEHPNPSLEQTIQIAQLLYEHSYPQSENRQQAKQKLLMLSRQSDFPSILIIQVIDAFCKKYIFQRADTDGEDNESQTSLSKDEKELTDDLQLVIQMLTNLAGHSDVPAERAIQIIEDLYEKNSNIQEKYQVLIRILWQLLQNPSLTVEQKMRSTVLPIEGFRISMSDKAQTIQIMVAQLPQESVRHCLRNYHTSLYFLNVDEISQVTAPDLSAAVELSGQELLPINERNDLYDWLDWVIRIE